MVAPTKAIIMINQHNKQVRQFFRSTLVIVVIAFATGCTQVGKQDEVNDTLDSMHMDPRIPNAQFPKTNNSYGDSLHRMDSSGVHNNADTIKH
jgi:hypothetical protein